METRRPCRIVVFASGPLATTKRRKPRATGYAYIGWREHQAYSEARLPGAGSFLFPGLHAVRRAALAYLALPETHQVSIRTNQDRSIYRYFKASDGHISGYGG
jgi:hypothetical protein